MTWGGQCIGACWMAQLAPNTTIVIGWSSDTPSGHTYGRGGGGLHVAFGGHSVLIAAEQPSAVLNTVHWVLGSGVVGRGGFMLVPPGGGGGCDDGGGGSVGRGGFMIGRRGGGCGVWSTGSGRGGFATTGGGSFCADWGGGGWGGGAPVGCT